MSLHTQLRERYDRAERYLRAHPIVRWLVLATIPGVAYALAGFALSGDHLTGHLLQGAVFGVVFATLTVLIDRVRGDGR